MEAKPGGMFVPRRTLTYNAPRDSYRIHLMSDLHIGAQNVDYKLMRKEIEACIKHDRRICVNGDVFDRGARMKRTIIDYLMAIAAIAIGLIFAVAVARG